MDIDVDREDVGMLLALILIVPAMLLIKAFKIILE
jgi:hypothetical protein